MANFDAFNNDFDFNSFIHYPEDNTESPDFALPSIDTSAQSIDFSDMPLFPMDTTCGDFNLFDMDDSTWDLANGNPFTPEIQTPDSSMIHTPAPQADDFRYAVDSWASTDHRLRSTKQKRRDAAIDLHLQRFMNDHYEFPTTDSEASPATFSITSSQPSSDESGASQPAGRELVFDLNLNTATQLPKKQKKRTKAQIEDYINARRNGACIKHKKQHKKCNCHEKQSVKTRLEIRSKRQRVAVPASIPGSGVLTPELMPTTTPSSLSVSSFSQSPVSHVDNVLPGDDIDTALASLPDLYAYQPAQRPQYAMPQRPFASHRGGLSSESSGPADTTAANLEVRRSTRGSLPASPRLAVISGHSRGTSQSGTQTRRPQELPVSPLSTTQPWAETAGANATAALLHRSSDMIASLLAMEWASRLYLGMAIQTMHVISACRPQLLQFLAVGSDCATLSELKPVPSGLIGCA